VQVAPNQIQRNPQVLSHLPSRKRLLAKGDYLLSSCEHIGSYVSVSAKLRARMRVAR
jgi:hypothetical protein